MFMATANSSSKYSLQVATFHLKGQRDLPYRKLTYGITLYICLLTFHIPHTSNATEPNLELQQPSHCECITCHHTGYEFDITH